MVIPGLQPLAGSGVDGGSTANLDRREPAATSGTGFTATTVHPVKGLEPARVPQGVCVVAGGSKSHQLESPGPAVTAYG